MTQAARRTVRLVAEASMGVQELWRAEYADIDPHLRRLEMLNQQLGMRNVFTACHRLETLFDECIYDPKASTLS